MEQFFILSNKPKFGFVDYVVGGVVGDKFLVNFV